jgi:carbamoyl-phosphate synthase large subunit
MYRVLVTGVGAVIGYGIVRSLRSLPERVQIVGMDIFQDAVGQHWCDHFAVATPAAAPEYAENLARLVEQYSIDLVLPGIEQDAARMLKELPVLSTLHARFALNNPALMRVAADKWDMHHRLQASGFAVIPTRIEGDFRDFAREFGIPFLLKPRRSYASKGITRIHTQEALKYWRRQLGDNFMVQKIVGDDDAEYTVGAFGLGDGTYSQSIAFRRKLSGEGATAKAQVVEIPELNTLLAQLVGEFKPVGPTNFQFREHDDHLLMLEINPRISSSTSLRNAFGYNEAGMCIEYYLKGKVPAIETLRSGHAVRYIEDMIFYDCNHL